MYIISKNNAITLPNKTHTAYSKTLVNRETLNTTGECRGGNCDHGEFHIWFIYFFKEVNCEWERIKPQLGWKIEKRKLLICVHFHVVDSRTIPYVANIIATNLRSSVKLGDTIEIANDTSLFFSSTYENLRISQLDTVTVEGYISPTTCFCNFDTSTTSVQLRRVWQRRSKRLIIYPYLVVREHQCQI